MSKFLKLSVVAVIAVSAILYKLDVVLADAKISVVVTPDTTTAIMAGGLVTYNYQIFTLGSDLLTDIVITDDKCSPLVYTGGDVNNDKKLDNQEVWKYTCQINLNKTTTNTATVTGKLAATPYSATATSTVNVTILDRSIKVKKIATPEQITANSGQVVYTYEVTNPGSLALQNITVTDDKCASVNLANGDVNSNNKLDSGETWRYICYADLTATTTSVATARGQESDKYVTDVASLTVLVGKDAKAGAIVPKALPKTGGGGAAGSSLNWLLLLAPVALIGIVNSRKKIFKKSYLGN